MPILKTIKFKLLFKKGLSKHQVGVLKDTSIDNKFMMMLLLIFY
jgi:hypothetical protein